MSPSVVAAAPRAILWLPENSLEFRGHSTRQSCCSSPWVATGGSSPSLCTLLQRGTFSLDRGAVGTHELTQASLQSPQSRAAPPGVVLGRQERGPHRNPAASNPRGEQTQKGLSFGLPQSQTKGSHTSGTRRFPGWLRAQLHVVPGCPLMPLMPPSLSWLCPKRAPPELPPRETPSDVGAKAINCTQPSLELEIHQLAFNS